MSTLPPRSNTEVLYEDRFVFWLRAWGCFAVLLSGYQHPPASAGSNTTDEDADCVSVVWDGERLGDIYSKAPSGTIYSQSNVSLVSVNSLFILRQMWINYMTRSLNVYDHTSDMAHAAEGHKVLSYKLLKIWGRFPNPPTPLGRRQEHDYLQELMQHPPRGACFLTTVVQRSRWLRIYLVFRPIDSAKVGE